MGLKRQRHVRFHALTRRLGTLILLATAVPTVARAQAPAGSDRLGSELIPHGISTEVWNHALAAHREATRTGRTTSLTLTIIDYSLPAIVKRLWVVDVVTHRVLATDYLAHGEGSGNLWATRFSNKDGTHQSSLGTFITGSAFDGVRGYSLRLHGIEPGINDNAYNRGLVFHGTPGVSEARARKGAMGRTEGCPAVSSQSVRRLIGLIANGSVVFAWYPDPGFLEKSEFGDRGTGPSR